MPLSRSRIHRVQKGRPQRTDRGTEAPLETAEATSVDQPLSSLKDAVAGAEFDAAVATRPGRFEASQK